MKKLAVVALVLALVGVAAAGAVHVQRSICNGVCPLTGRPIHRSAPAAAECPPTPDCPYSDERCAERQASAGAALDAAPAADDGCPTTHARACCGKRRECAERKQEEPKPAAPQTQNP